MPVFFGAFRLHVDCASMHQSQLEVVGIDAFSDYFGNFVEKDSYFVYTIINCSKFPFGKQRCLQYFVRGYNMEGDSI